REAAEMTFVELDRVQQILTEVDVPAFEQCEYLAAGSLADLHLNLGIALGVAVQESGQHTFDVLRRAGDLEDAGIATTQQLSLFLHGTGAVEKQAAAGNQLLAFAGQEQPAPDPIEK